MENKVILYHTSYCVVNEPNLELCSDNRDFGKGFYLTSSYIQARRFVKTSLRKAKMEKFIDEKKTTGYINKFEFDVTLLKQLKTHEFAEANREWLHCVVAHRRRDVFQELIPMYMSYDIMIAKLLMTVQVQQFSPISMGNMAKLVLKKQTVCACTF